MGVGAVRIAVKGGADAGDRSWLDADLLVLDLALDRDRLDDLCTALEGKGHAAPAVALVVGTGNHDLQRRVLTLPHSDCVREPFEPLELEVRVRNLLRLRSAQRRVDAAQDEVRSRMAANTAELEDAREDALRRLAWAAEYRDDLTGQHAERVGIVAGLVARELGCPPSERALIEKAAPLHDLGKIAIPDSILGKPGGLTPAERDVMKSHTTIGGELLSGSRNPLLQLAALIAQTHHEWWDGGGYPNGLAGTAIPQPGRIVAVADVFDSLTNHRPYRDAVGRQEALQTIRDGTGSHFDPEVSQAFMRVVESGALSAALNMDIVALPDRV
jgi:putative two-component system response regulator